ncbi:dolichyl-phosphate beta-glucosyltransferase-like [Argonauta hians]
MLFAGLVLIALVILISLGIVYILAEPHPSLIRYESEMFFIDPKNNNEKSRFPNNSDAASIDLSVVVPAYNEEERMPQMLNEAIAFLNKRQKKNLAFTYEIIIVDDGSRDKTTETGLLYVEKYGSDKIRVLTLEKNRGKGGAIRLGVLSSRGRKVLYADADGATKFSDLEKLEKKLAEEIRKTSSNMVVVCGSRAHLEKDSIATRTYFRTILMYGFHFAVWFLCVRGVKDTQCGFKLLSREAALLLFRNLHVERWAFDVDILYLAQYLKMNIAEVAVTWEEIEGSKLVPFWSWLQMGRDLVLIWLHYAIGAWKINAKPKVT